MRYKELIMAIKKDTNIPFDYVRRVIDSFQDIVVAEARANKPVYLNRLGVIKTKITKPKTIKLNNKITTSEPNKKIIIRTNTKLKKELTEAAKYTKELENNI